MIKLREIINKYIKKPDDKTVSQPVHITHTHKPIVSDDAVAPLAEDIARLILPSVNGYWLKYRYGNVPVCGIEQLTEQAPFLSSKIGDFANLILETDNEAIRVTTSEGKKLGYLLKDEKLTNLAFEHLQAGCRVLCLISSVSFNDYKLSMLVGFYVKRL